ncbi:ABC transporter ATP-binding protein [Halomonas organivorans]|uniref:Capsular polysaccharide transport system ATP-binding protein n=1 Tax=Halomonas organivorans TaxID=257772 RepID=A0A7W5C0P8_9GAMM|nr:ABC transporter ATP-binding protein [Halomonas organivorans]MBB3142604.1 capsular polysaccharide transport system ATP-binding protein [Halomonas organivorans]
MIHINGLYKRYHNHHGSDWVLRDVNLTIPRNVSVGLLGRNGAGKSTLLRLIAGMDSPERGTIERGCRVSWPIGLAGGFQGSMTGRQNVKFVARVHGGRGNVQGVIDRVQEFSELDDAFDEPIKTYSSGMRARLNFGLSLAFDFDVYLSDEATAVGDRAFKEKAKKAFKDKVGQASLIMVSHTEGILKELCQAGVYLKEGQAIWYDDIEDAIAAYHDDTDTSQARRQPTPTNLPEAQQYLRLCKQEFDDAKAAFEQAKADNLIPRERKVFGDALGAARERLHDARRHVQAMQSSEDD